MFSFAQVQTKTLEVAEKAIDLAAQANPQSDDFSAQIFAAIIGGAFLLLTTIITIWARKK